MDKQISYGVFWRGKANAYAPDPEWHLFFGWTSYNIALEMSERVKKNPRCAELKIVKRTETFECIYGTSWQREEHHE